MHVMTVIQGVLTTKNKTEHDGFTVQSDGLLKTKGKLEIFKMQISLVK